MDDDLLWIYGLTLKPEILAVRNATTVFAMKEATRTLNEKFLDLERKLNNREALYAVQDELDLLSKDAKTATDALKAVLDKVLDDSRYGSINYYRETTTLYSFQVLIEIHTGLVKSNKTLTIEKYIEIFKTKVPLQLAQKITPELTEVRADIMALSILYERKRPLISSGQTPAGHDAMLKYFAPIMLDLALRYPPVLYPDLKSSTGASGTIKIESEIDSPVETLIGNDSSVAATVRVTTSTAQITSLPDDLKDFIAAADAGLSVNQ